MIFLKGLVTQPFVTGLRYASRWKVKESLNVGFLGAPFSGGQVKVLFFTHQQPLENAFQIIPRSTQGWRRAQTS